MSKFWMLNYTKLGEISLMKILLSHSKCKINVIPTILVSPCLKYSFQIQANFLRISINSSTYDLTLLQFFTSKVWQMFTVVLKNLKKLDNFENNIRK